MTIIACASSPLVLTFRCKRETIRTVLGLLHGRCDEPPKEHTLDEERIVAGTSLSSTSFHFD